MADDDAPKPKNQSLKKKKKKGNGDPRKWPHHSPEFLDQLNKFLSWYKLQADKGYETAKASEKRTEDYGFFNPQLDYWENCQKCINWLWEMAQRRQFYLTIPLEPEPTPEQPT